MRFGEVSSWITCASQIENRRLAGPPCTPEHHPFIHSSIHPSIHPSSYSSSSSTARCHRVVMLESGGNYDVAAMSDILDHGLGEQLAMALLTWGGEQDQEARRQPRTQPDHHNEAGADARSDSSFDSASDSGFLTPLARHHVYFHKLMRFADDSTWSNTALGPHRRDIDANLEDGNYRDDNLDATDSDSTFTTQPAKSTNICARYRQHRVETMENPPLPPQNWDKELPPTPFDTTPTSSSSHPQMSCRISTFPFSHPCDIPELILDPDEGHLHTEPSPLPSGPATPSVVNDIFQPLSQTASPDLEFGPFTPLALEADPQHSMEQQQQSRKMSIKTMVSDVSDGLGIIEEEDDVNTDGVSMLTPTEASFGGAAGGESSIDRFGRADSRAYQPQAWSISSSAGSIGSSEWRPSIKSSRKSVTLLSRMRGRHSVVQEEPLEKRSLTPYELSAPAPRQDNDNCVDMPPPPTGSSLPTIHSRTEITSTTNPRFFGRIPWLTSDSQPEKQGTVFGVDLNSSIKMAPMKIRVSHRGRGSSYRTYPLGVYKCCEFIRKEGNKAGKAFCSPGNAFNVAQLKEIFNTGPTYGENFQFEGTNYTVHDAARLILLYLEELPKPLITSSVVRCWVLLARQEGAIEPPCPRVETGLDFWTEALSRLPTASRNLVKHLLAIFAEVLLQTTGNVTEADSRHFASAVSRALFHQDTDASVVAGGAPTASKKKTNKRSVHPTLALAFLIKKRGEYSATLGKATNMGTKRDTQFLPTTKEIMQWKG
ncbi:Putative Rho-GTPase-activating protein [Podospora comata]|uniref:Rho-GTPase-activating protein n=1 Tax=Podospora comata TaxID=48703 RepID=A0ABY6S4P6_PODCO|nr:Putative Rho-GTPase-activating protein [Podospora comata]